MLPRSAAMPVSIFTTNLDEDARVARFRKLAAGSPLFRGLGPTAVDDLARRTQQRTRSAGAVVVTQDEPGDSLFLVCSGKVKVSIWGDGLRELTLAHLGPGEFFGEMSLLDGSPRSANVTALDDCTFLVLTREAFADHLRQHPQTALNLLGELARRLRRADETMADLALHDVHERLVRALERIGKDGGERTADGILLRRRPTQQELANMIGACRETISRAFTQLCSQGLLVSRGRSLLVTHRLLGKEPAKAQLAGVPSL